MVLEPVKYTWSREGVKTQKNAKGYASAEVPGLVIGVHDWDARDGHLYRYYDLTHVHSGFGFTEDQFTELSSAARFMAGLGELCDWREVVPGNELHTRLGPVVKAFREAWYAEGFLEIAATHLENYRKEHDDKVVTWVRAGVRLEAALETFREQP